MTRWARLGAICSLAAVAAAGQPGFRWPVAEGWRKETIPFPLEFARDLPFSGVEELRFAPGMFGVSPTDGRIVVSAGSGDTDVMLAEGIPGIGATRGKR